MNIVRGCSCNIPLKLPSFPVWYWQGVLLGFEYPSINETAAKSRSRWGEHQHLFHCRRDYHWYPIYLGFYYNSFYLTPGGSRPYWYCLCLCVTIATDLPHEPIDVGKPFYITARHILSRVIEYRKRQIFMSSLYFAKTRFKQNVNEMARSFIIHGCPPDLIQISVVRARRQHCDNLWLGRD